MTGRVVSVVESRPFPTRFAILPSSKYVFAQAGEARELTVRIVLERTLSNGLQVVVVNYGLLDFAATNLGAFYLIEGKSAGVVPDEVMTSREHSWRYRRGACNWRCLWRRASMVGTHT